MPLGTDRFRSKAPEQMSRSPYNRHPLGPALLATLALASGAVFALFLLGAGLPAGFSLEKSDRLGLQIVRTLVSTELDGSLGMHDAAGGGTDAVLRVPLGRRARSAQ